MPQMPRVPVPVLAILACASLGPVSGARSSHRAAELALASASAPSENAGDLGASGSPADDALHLARDAAAAAGVVDSHLRSAAELADAALRAGRAASAADQLELVRALTALARNDGVTGELLGVISRGCEDTAAVFHDSAAREVFDTLLVTIACSPRATSEIVAEVVALATSAHLAGRPALLQVALAPLIAAASRSVVDSEGMRRMEQMRGMAARTPDGLRAFCRAVGSAAATEAMLAEFGGESRVVLQVLAKTARSAADADTLDAVLEILRVVVAIDPRAWSEDLLTAGVFAAISQSHQADASHAARCLDVWDAKRAPPLHEPSETWHMDALGSLTALARSPALDARLLDRVFRSVEAVKSLQFGHGALPSDAALRSHIGAFVAVAAHPACGFDLLDRVVEAAEQRVNEWPFHEERLGALQALSIALSSPDFARFRELRTALVAGLLLSAVARVGHRGARILGAECPKVLRMIGGTPSPVADITGHLQRAGLTPELIAEVRRLSTTPRTVEVCRAAIRACAQAPAQEPEAGAWMAAGLWRAVCAADPLVRLEAAEGFAGRVRTYGDAQRTLSDEDLLVVGRCLRSRPEEDVGGDLARVLLHVLGGVEGQPPGEGRRTLCATLRARVEEVADVPAFDARSYERRLAAACGAAPVGAR